MFVVRIQGGLGNQIFQYLFAQKLKKHFPDTEVLIDLDSYRRYHPHNGYELDKHFILDSDIGELPIGRYHAASGLLPYLGNPRHSYPWLISKSLGAVNHCVDMVNRCLDARQLIRQHYAPHYPSLDLSKLDPSRNLYFDGTWFNETDLSLAVKEGRIRFREVDDNAVTPLLQAMEGRESVSIHVRHGDYSAWGYELLSDDYYRSAIAYMKEHLSNPVFYLFSDDPEYVKHSILPLCEGRGTLVEGNNGDRSWLDLFLISKCKHHIVANSSFSYSARILSGSDGLLVAPSKWINGNETWDIPGCKYFAP